MSQVLLFLRLVLINATVEWSPVNVNARLPFNLHKNLSSITNTMDRHPWTSSNLRSASTSTPNRGRGLVLLSSTPHSHAQIQAHVGRPLTVVPPWRTWSQTHMLLDPGHLAWLLGLYTRSRFGNVQGGCITKLRYPCTPRSEAWFRDSWIGRRSRGCEKREAKDEEKRKRT